MKFLKKILLVDHQPQVTALVQRALESTGRYLVKVEQDSRLAVTERVRVCPADVHHPRASMGHGAIGSAQGTLVGSFGETV